MISAVLRGWLMKRVGCATSPQFWDRFVAHSALQSEFAGMLASARQIPSREELWNHVIEKAGAENPHLFLEFGVWEGYSMKHFSRALTHPNSRFVGFDSFEGLPSDWGAMPQGTFTTGGRVPQIDDARVEFVVGWFQNTVEPALDRILSSRETGSIVVHFDADLYSSTLFLLAVLHGRIDSYRMLFDEFPGHECRALFDFVQAFGCRVTFEAYTLGPTRQFPMQVCGLIENCRGSYSVR
jgi:hypothetical protein